MYKALFDDVPDGMRMETIRTVVNSSRPAIELPAIFSDANLSVDGDGSHGGPRLSDLDARLVAEVNCHRAAMISVVWQVRDGLLTAALFWGEGGHGKSNIIRCGLMGYEKVRWHTGDISARELFNQLKEFPDHIHVFEDTEKIYKDLVSMSILRAAIGGQTQQERRVAWEKHGKSGEDPFVFGGAIIIVTNENPRGGSLKMGALASRVAPLRWHLTDPELAALMRDIALNGECPLGLSVEERLEIAEFIIDKMHDRPSGVRVDLRTLCEHGLPAYLQWKRGDRRRDALAGRAACQDHGKPPCGIPIK